MNKIRDIILDIKLSLNPMSRVPGWKAAAREERLARQRNDTRAIGRSVRAKRAAVIANMRGAR